MKHARIWVALVMVLVVLVGLTGCHKTQPTHFMLYTFDTEDDVFIPLGCELSFDEAHTEFCYNYLGTVQLFGEMRDTAMGYALELDANVFLQAAQALNALTEEQAEALDEETLQIWKNYITVREQVYLLGDHVFSSSSIDLIRRVEGEDKSTYTSIDGYYESAQDTDTIFLFKDGMVYANVKDADGNATFDGTTPKMQEAASATYVLNNGFIVMTQIDKNGGVLLNPNGKPRIIVYLLASITYPKDVADFVYVEDDYSATIKTLAEQLAGKSVGVMTKTFYSSKNLNELNFA